MSSEVIICNKHISKTPYYPDILYKSIFVFMILFFAFGFVSFSIAQSSKWVGTWSCAPYAAAENTPPSPYLANNSLRQIVRVSIGGDTLRVKFSNGTSSTPVTLNSVNIAVSTEIGGSAIDTSTIKQLKFDGDTSVTMNAYSTVTSDPLAFSLTPGMHLAITIYYGQINTSADMTFHYGSRTDSYILEGNYATSASFEDATIVERWYTINAIDVRAPDTSAAVVVLGNSITDGYGLHGGLKNKWTDIFSQRLLDNPATSHVAVLNMGIGATWFTSSGVNRFQQDVLDQTAVRWVIIFYGVNDIGGNAPAEDIISAYKNVVARAHAQNIRVYGVTITPFEGHGYYTDAHETARVDVNEWLRTPGNVDKCIDFDKAIRDPADTTRMLEEYSNDWLHPNVAGYAFLGESVNLNLFLGGDTTFPQPVIEEHYFEAECAVIGADWDIIDNAQASNGKYVTVKSGTQSLEQPPTDQESFIIIPFSVDTSDNFSLYARINCPTYDDDSFWVKMDDGEYTLHNSLVTSGWQWVAFNDYMLNKGEHMLTIAYREDGALLDKMAVSNSLYSPSGLGEEAENLCIETGLNDLQDTFYRYTLQQNYPNPFNPITNIEYSVRAQHVVSQPVVLSIYNLLGQRLATLVNKKQTAGSYNIKWDASGFPSGIYIYTLETDGGFKQSRKLVLLK